MITISTLFYLEILSEKHIFQWFDRFKSDIISSTIQLVYCLVFFGWPLFDRYFQRPVINGTSRKLSAEGYACYEHIKSTDLDSPQAFCILKPVVDLGTTWCDADVVVCLKVVMGILVALLFFCTFLPSSSSKQT